MIAASATSAPELPGTGRLKVDLRALLPDIAVALTGEAERLMRTLIGGAAHNTVLAQSLATALMPPVRRRVDGIVERAVHRGEIAT